MATEEIARDSTEGYTDESPPKRSEVCAEAAYGRGERGCVHGAPMASQRVREVTQQGPAGDAERAQREQQRSRIEHPDDYPRCVFSVIRKGGLKVDSQGTC